MMQRLYCEGTKDCEYLQKRGRGFYCTGKFNKYIERVESCFPGTLLRYVDGCPLWKEH